ncbi:MAG: hypothetical protein KBE41_04725 [Lutibacter sp.]|nr:hypothetical protein [Lutibacter sp.]
MKNLVVLSFCIFSLTSHAQVEVSELKEVNNQIVEIQTKFDTKQSELLKEIEKLNSDLKSLNSNEFLKRISVLELKQGKLDSLKIIEQNKEVLLYETKYTAGVLIIKDIIESLKALKSQYAAVKFNNSYQELTNPNKYLEYNQNIEFLKKKLVKSGLTLPELNLGNSVLNTVYAITRGVVSGQNDKDEIIEQLYCILDFTSSASQELTIVKYDLKYLEFSIDKMLLDYENLFKSYTQLVGYKNDFNTYKNDANENLQEKIKEYFASIGKIETSKKDKLIKSTKFNLKLIIDAHINYENFISQNTAYYEKFELIINGINPTCTNNLVNVAIKSKYDVVKVNLELAKQSFKAAFSNTIKQSYLRDLIQ